MNATNRLAAPQNRKKAIQAMFRRVQTGSGKVSAWPMMRLISRLSPTKWLPMNARANSQLTTGAFHLRNVSLWKARVRLPKTRQAIRVSHWLFSSLRCLMNSVP
ncbi:hypothetical protein D9M73_214160 [compost metagenome]